LIFLDGDGGKRYGTEANRRKPTEEEYHTGLGAAGRESPPGSNLILTVTDVWAMNSLQSYARDARSSKRSAEYAEIPKLTVPSCVRIFTAAKPDSMFVNSNRRFTDIAKIVLIVAVGSVIGCGGGSAGSASAGASSPPSAPTPPPSTPPSVPGSGSEYLYEFSSSSSTKISRLNTTTGELGAPVDAVTDVSFENQGVPAAVTPSGKYMYEQGFYQSPPPGPPFFGKPLQAIWGFAINGVDGTLSSLPNMPVPQGTEGLGFTPNGMVMDSQGKFLFVSVYNGTNTSGQSQNVIFTYAIDAESGSLTKTSTLNSTAQSSLSVSAVDPSGTYLYASSVLPTGQYIAVYSISPTDGALTEIAGSPFLVVKPADGTIYTVRVVPGSSGRIVYVTMTSISYNSPGISSFLVDPATHSISLVAGSPFPVGSIYSVVFGSSGSFLYASVPGEIAVYGIKSMTGEIEALPRSTTTVGSFLGTPIVDPTGRFLVSNDGFGTASSWKIDSSTGVLALVPGSPFNAGQLWSTALIVRIP
jgi:Lactonase, 7-bladed beta-propeller